MKKDKIDINNTKIKNIFKSFNHDEVLDIKRISNLMKEIHLKNWDKYLFNSSLEELWKIKNFSNKYLATDIKLNDKEWYLISNIFFYELENWKKVIITWDKYELFEDNVNVSFYFDQDIKWNICKITKYKDNNLEEKYFRLWEEEISTNSSYKKIRVLKEILWYSQIVWKLKQEKTIEEYENELEEKKKNDEIWRKVSFSINSSMFEQILPTNKKDIIEEKLKEMGFTLDKNSRYNTEKSKTYISDINKDNVFVSINITEDYKNNELLTLFLELNQRKHLDIDNNIIKETKKLYEKINNYLLNLKEENKNNVEEIINKSPENVLRRLINEWKNIWKNKIEIEWKNWTKDEYRLFISTTDQICYLPKWKRSKGYVLTWLDNMKNAKLI